MCDDFFDDYFEDNLFDPSDDFEEDIAEEYTFNDSDDFISEESIDQETAENYENRQFDMAEAVIFGSMVVGNAIEESRDEKRRKQLIDSEDDQNKE